MPRFDKDGRSVAEQGEVALGGYHRIVPFVKNQGCQFDRYMGMW
jgi:hypothetical protein